MREADKEETVIYKTMKDMKKSTYMKKNAFRRFRRYDEYGFVNPDYDKTQMAIGVTVMILLVLLFIFFAGAALIESMPRNPYDYGQYLY